ncbi:hypothetical protein CP061683_1155A, partial [Chlamydia psittaci 06-1683]|jgi:hypothetical protein
MRKLV